MKKKHQFDKDFPRIKQKPLAFGRLKKPPPIVIMPIEVGPSGTLDIENATLRSRNIVALTSLVAGNDVVRSSAAPTLEVYGDPSNTGGLLPRLELVSNVEAVGSAFTRLTSNAGVFTIQSGTAGTGDSKGDIAFSSIDGTTEHMRIQGSTGNVGIGTTNPGKKLEIAHGYQSLGGYIDTYLVSGVVGGMVLGTRQGGGTHIDGIHITDSGNVGIGTANPKKKLHVYGGGTATDIMFGEDTAIDKTSLIRYNQGDGSATGVLQFGHWGDSFGSNPETLCIKSGGNVGIGVTTPNQKLHVNGNAQINNLVIKSGSGNYTTSGVYTGLNMNGGNGGGLVIMMVSHQNNGGDNTGMFVHVLKRRYSGATSLFPYSPGAIQLVNSSQGTAAGKSITYYTDTSAVLKFNFNYATNYKWGAIEL